VILGHSERRQYQHETDKQIAEKAKGAMVQGLVPVICIGDTAAQRDAGETFDVLKKQLEGSCAFALDAGEIIVAYEPVWAIGTGNSATPDQIQDVHAFLRKTYAARQDVDHAESLRILYGGSVKPANAADILPLPDVDGALLGGASLEAASFCEIIAIGL